MSVSNLSLLQHHNQLVTAIASDENIPREIRNLLVGIATFFNVSNQCAFPSRRQISERTGYCTNHITALIKQAVDLGVIRSIPQFYLVEGESAPRQTSNRYEFILEKFGLFWNRTKALLNRNLKKRQKQPHPDYQEAPTHVNGHEFHKYSSDYEEYLDLPPSDWEEYAPPK